MLPSPSATSGGQGILPTPGSTAGTKRPATSDLHRAAGATSTPTKRHATKGSVGSAAGAGLAGASIMQTPTTAPPAPPPPPLHHQPPPPQYPHQHVLAPGPAHAPPPPMPTMITEDQLLGRPPEQLMATILQIQNQHQQYVASISAQYESITHQLNELRSSLAAFYNGQASAHQAAIAHLQSSPPNPFGGDHPRMPRAPVAPAPHPIASQPPQPPQASPPRPPPSMRPTRPPPQSPLQPHSDARLLPKQSTAQAPQTPGPPAYDYRTVGTVEEVWKEYREGMDGQPAIEELDSTWGSRWRPEPRGRTWYSRRKVIWDKIKDFIAEGMEEDEAVKEVEKLRDGGTINKLIRSLQEERKEKGLPDDSITT
ncbi:hypothetical protein PG996_012522 [Apiospora saccharicola]|uniref:Transcription activator GCR1-like domain-containing protein n=1 Tax=Apiospora saccharicola TaxID=335842 RepID=A0ABR1U2U3_9PEZI